MEARQGWCRLRAPSCLIAAHPAVNCQPALCQLLYLPTKTNTMVEVFKTNVVSRGQAALLLQQIHKRFPAYRANFDLQDCDRILRVVSATGVVEVAAVMKLLHDNGFYAEPLADDLLPERLLLQHAAGGQG